MFKIQQTQPKEEDDLYRVDDHIIQRYDIIEVKGKGAYGIVWKAQDKKTT